jgi:pyruvate/2-oxoglutarate dehydrogenase complex dihydrolipoamide acyltransferase (E2) component
VKSEKRVKMGKKTRKAIEDLSESVAKTQKRNAKLLEGWAGRVVEALEAQTESNREMTRILQSYLNASGEDRQHEEGARSTSVQNEDYSGAERESETEREVTEAAERKAEELEVDLDEVEGTGSSGRVVVSDVEDAAERAEGESTPA